MCQRGPLAGKSLSNVLVTGSAPTAMRLSATAATISAVSSGPAVDSVTESLPRRRSSSGAGSELNGFDHQQQGGEDEVAAQGEHADPGRG